MNKGKKKLKAERLKSFQEFNHLSGTGRWHCLFMYIKGKMCTRLLLES